MLKFALLKKKKQFISQASSLQAHLIMHVLSMLLIISLINIFLASCFNSFFYYLCPI